MPSGRLVRRRVKVARPWHRARGRAAKIIQDAQAYREQTVADAKGQASRFSQIHEQYKKAPDVTRQRIYLETMERILGAAGKTIIDSGAQSSSGVVPYLPLDRLPRERPTSSHRRKPINEDSTRPIGNMVVCGLSV